MNSREFYNANPNIKREGVKTNWTPELVEEYQRCMNDPVYFAETYCKVINLDEGLVKFKLYPYQKDMFKHFTNNRFSIVLACRQSGKSITSVMWLLHYIIFNPDKNVAILANKGSTAQTMLSRFTLALENVPFFLQPGTRVLNKRSIEFENNSRIFAASTSSSSIRGESANVVFLDEFAFVKGAEEFYKSTYPVISSGAETKVIISSTANGVGNPFHKLWEGAVQGINEYKPFTVNWWDVPGRDEKWKEMTISNTSELQFLQEYGNCVWENSLVTVRNKDTGEIEQLTIGELFSKTKNHEILTPTGFQNFDGVVRHWHDECVEITFSDNHILKTALLHRFIVDEKEIYAKDITTETIIDKNRKISNIRIIHEPQYFYDPINVENGELYIHDKNIVSHNSFIGTGNTLIDSNALLMLRARNPIKCTSDINVYEEPIEGHTYIATVDVSKGRGQDYSIINITDVTQKPFKQVFIYRNNKVSPLIFPDIIYKYAKQYNDAYVIVESNDAGLLVCSGLYYDLEYEYMYVQSAMRSDGIGLYMDKKVKRIGCSNLKDLIEANQYEVRDANTIYELTTFCAKGSSFEATDGNHDDIAMTLVSFAWFANSSLFEEFSPENLKQIIQEEQLKQAEEDLTPFGIIEDGHPDKYEVIGGDVWEEAENPGIY